MNKIPVGQTINYAYSFGFGHFGAVLGIVWAPLLVLCVAAFFLYLPMLMTMISMAASGRPDPMALQQAIMQSIGAVFLFDLIAIFILSVTTTGITRLALGLDRPTAFYFSVGKQVWLNFASWIVLIILFIVFGFVVGIVLGVINAWVMTSFSDPQSMVLFSLVQMIALLLLFAFLGIRLSYFISPVVVSEDKLGLFRSWQLTGGNFWRIFCVVLVIFLPPLIVFYLAIVGVVMAMGLPAIQAGEQLPMTMLIIIGVLYVLFAVLVMGMSNGAAAFAYRAIAGTPPGQQPATT